MTDHLAELTRRVPPPVDPVDAAGDWSAVEAALSVSLPADYRALVERYGWGAFADFLSVHTPFGNRAHSRVEWQGTPQFVPAGADAAREYPYPLHPSPGGLLIWGSDEDANRLGWLTDGPADTWSVVIWGRGGGYEEHPMGAARFLDRWVTGTLESALLPANDTGLAPWFEPARTRRQVCVRLDEGELPYVERLRILREALTPTADRGAEVGADDRRRDHFAATARDWLVTYEAMYDHRIRVSFPPDDDEWVRRDILAAVDLMGCRVVSTRLANGTPVWATAAR
ncbi:SMI1/KNR4 family protein [Streptomyces sp. SID3343]|uniref:SMI1/KNR4 family protein n=1 Tax=Streptomyces sp. SID3343 TaxID=2690260 RepID=UPI0013683B54|nr:hypothetical protein [Streptomyces sp. SID3343]